MGKRKIILLALAAFLLIVYVFQIASGNKSAVRELKLSEEMDKITLSSKESGDISLENSDDVWKVGKYKANENKVSQVVEQIKNIKILDKVSTSASDLALYGLDEENIIRVKAFSGENLLRTIEVGKASVTGGQTYVRVDGEKAVSLASGSLASLFSSTAEQFRDNSIYSFSSTDIEKVSSHSDTQSFTIMRLPAASEDGASEWALLTDSGVVDTERELDSAKVSFWISGLAILNASEWTDESDKSALNEKATIEISAKGKTIKVNIAEKGEDDKYTAECSESPYRFKITQYSGDNFLKELSALLK